MSAACFAVRRLSYFKHRYSSDNLLCIYSAITFGIAFWVNSTATDQVFVLQKRIVRIMAGVKRFMQKLI
jgi:hypothetical protein